MIKKLITLDNLGNKQTNKKICLPKFEFVVVSIASSAKQLKFSSVLRISKFAILPMSIEFKELDALLIDSVDAIS